MAKKQLIKSEEKELYKDLSKCIEKFEKIFEVETLKEILEKEKIKLGIEGVNKEEKLKQLYEEKEEIEKMIAAARQRYYTRKIDEESFRRIIKDYEKKLIELNIKIRSIKDEEGKNKEEEFT